jgi:hypothetical protein
MSRQNLQGLLVDRTTLRVLIFKLGLTQRQDCQQRGGTYCVSVSGIGMRKIQTLGPTFLKTKDLR